jgi:hypothetical protein
MMRTPWLSFVELAAYELAVHELETACSGPLEYLLSMGTGVSMNVVGQHDKYHEVPP